MWLKNCMTRFWLHCILYRLVHVFTCLRFLYKSIDRLKSIIYFGVRMPKYEIHSTKRLILLLLIAQARLGLSHYYYVCLSPYISNKNFPHSQKKFQELLNFHKNLDNIIHQVFRSTKVDIVFTCS